MLPILCRIFHLRKFNALFFVAELQLLPLNKISWSSVNSHKTPLNRSDDISAKYTPQQGEQGSFHSTQNVTPTSQWCSEKVRDLWRVIDHNIPENREATSTVPTARTSLDCGTNQEVFLYTRGGDRSNRCPSVRFRPGCRSQLNTVWVGRNNKERVIPGPQSHFGLIICETM